MPERILVCADWDDPSVLKDRIMGACKFCGKEVGFDAQNAMRVEADNYGFSCLNCFMAKFVLGGEPGTWGGSLVGGKMYSDLMKGIIAAHERKTGEKDTDA